MIALRPCEEDDLKALKELYDNVYTNDPYTPSFETLERFRQMFSRENIYFDRSLVALDDEEEGRIVAFLLVGVREKLARISAVGVHSDYRRRGIAKRLLNRVIRDLREIEDVSRIVAEVFIEDEAALNLFTDFGFDKKRIMTTYHRACPEQEVPKQNRYTITTEFPTELLKYYESYHTNEAPWSRSKESLASYNKRVVGYSISGSKGKMIGYVLVGFDHTILDIAMNVSISEDKEPMYALLYHIFSKFDNLITIDIPEDDNVFEVFEKTGFVKIYDKYELLLAFKQYDE